MTQHSHQTAPTQFVDAAGVRFAYRRFGKAGGVPLLFNQHFTGTMDHWDPLVTDGLAATREVILFNNAGISNSSGEVPTTFEEMGANAIAFIKALGHLFFWASISTVRSGWNPRQTWRCAP
jgi:pimeloyl-ACP methyl ester carboxylesterase